MIFGSCFVFLVMCFEPRLRSLAHPSGCTNVCARFNGQYSTRAPCSMNRTRPRAPCSMSNTQQSTMLMTLSHRTECECVPSLVASLVDQPPSLNEAELQDKAAHLAANVLRRTPEPISGRVLMRFVADRELSELTLSLRDPIDRSRMCVDANALRCVCVCLLLCNYCTVGRPPSV